MPKYCSLGLGGAVDRIWGMMGTQVACRGVFCRYFIVIFGDISQKAPSFLEIVRLNISESLQTLYIDSHGLFLIENIIFYVFLCFSGFLAPQKGRK